MILNLLVQLAFLIRVLLRPHREPASRIAWVVVVIALLVLGIVGYILLGEVNIGRHRVQRIHEVLTRLPAPGAATGVDATGSAVAVPQRHAHLFQLE